MEPVQRPPGLAWRPLRLRALAALRLEIALEDCLPMADFLAGELRVPVLWIDRPWNRDLSGIPAAAPITRVASLGEAARRCAGGARLELAGQIRQLSGT
jgi:hypothetical protein